MASPKRARKSSTSTPKKRQKLSSVKPATTGDDTSTRRLPEKPSSSERIKKQTPGQVRAPPPEPPSSVPASQSLIPPEADDPSLRETFDIHTIAVVANSKIQDKVRRVLALLQSDDGTSKQPAGDRPVKTALVALVSRADAVNKCISVAEIAKRELGKTEVRVWQYTGSWSRLETFEPNPKGEEATGDDAEKASDAEMKPPAEIEEEEDFEVMKIPSRKMVRKVPCVVIYMSRQAASRLQDLYG